MFLTRVSAWLQSEECFQLRCSSPCSGIVRENLGRNHSELGNWTWNNNIVWIFYSRKLREIFFCAANSCFRLTSVNFTLSNNSTISFCLCATAIWSVFITAHVDLNWNRFYICPIFFCNLSINCALQMFVMFVCVVSIVNVFQLCREISGKNIFPWFKDGKFREISHTLDTDLPPEWVDTVLLAFDLRCWFPWRRWASSVRVFVLP